MPLAAAYEDEELLIMDKPAGLAVTPGGRESLCALVFSERPELASVPGHRAGEGGLLNRLDNDTGGLVLFAKNREAFLFYTAAMRAERILKTYAAVVHGAPSSPAGRVEAPLGHSAKSARRMLVADGGRKIRGRPLPAVTAWRLLDSHSPFALVEAEIAKGVRHQIRVHLASIGLPIVGDRLYNKKGSAALTPHHLLFCRRVRFFTPAGEEKTASAAAPFAASWRDLADRTAAG